MFPGNLWETTNALTGEAIDFPSHGVFVREIPWVGNPHNPEDADNPSGIDDMEQARLVRQALARSVDREAIVEHVLGGVGQPVHVTYFSTFNPNWESQYEYPYDPAEAGRMLDQADIQLTITAHDSRYRCSSVQNWAAVRGLPVRSAMPLPVSGRTSAFE